MTRRELLWLPAVGFLPAAAVRASDPENVSYPLGLVEGTLTPPNRFFVRDHFSPPEVSLANWRLRIEGRVERPYDLTFSDLVELPATRVEAVLECAGNAAGGAAVSNGVWEGVPFSALLDGARPAADAAFLLLEGSDSGSLLPARPALPYSQIVPLAKCKDPASLVAFKLNDLALPKRNGFPARALLPGWYGMDSVKWLRRIVVLGPEDRDTIFHQSGIADLYNRVTRSAGTVTRLSSLQVKSCVAWPADSARLPAGRHPVWGFAWAGSSPLSSIVVSTDNAKSWSPARFTAPQNGYGWVRWSFTWEAKPGEYLLMSRAADGSGAEQPLHRDPARKDIYEANWCIPVRCSVR